MQNAALSIELDETETPSIWPWVIAAIAFILLCVSVRSDLKHIPRSISLQAHSLAQSMGASSIDISVDGRDINTSGILATGVDRENFVQSLSSIDGARVVVDDMVEFDPREQARLDLLGFKEGLSDINFSQVSFERGSASLTNESREPLLQLVQVLQAYPQYRIRIAGHTDNTGRAEVNLRISRQRAGSVADFLIDNNINSNQIISQGYGATRPIADNSTEAGRAANRRIEISYVN